MLTPKFTFMSTLNSKGTLKSSIQDFEIIYIYFKVACHPL